MSCALTQGYSFGTCGDLFSGVDKIYIIEKANVTAVTVASGVVTGITKATGKLFREYNIKTFTGDANEVKTVNRDNDTSIVKQTIAFPIQGLSASVRMELELLAKNLITAVVLDENGVGWLYGKDHGLRLLTTNAKTGKTSQDFTGYELSLEGEEKYLAFPIDATTLTSLTVAGS